MLDFYDSNKKTMQLQEIKDVCIFYKKTSMKNQFQSRHTHLSIQAFVAMGIKELNFSFVWTNRLLDALQDKDVFRDAELSN